MPGIPWTQSGNRPVTVSEIDVVGHRWQVLGRSLPAGVRLRGIRAVNDFLVGRFAIDPAQRLTPAQIDAEAGQLLGPPVAGAAVLVQGPSRPR